MEKIKNKQNKQQQKPLLKKTKYVNLDLNPYLKNFEKEEQYTIPIFIPHKGCKNDCVFCNQRRISGQIVPPTYNEVDNRIKEYLGYYSKKLGKIKIEVAFFGGSFTGISKKEQEEYLKIANKYLKEGKITGIRLSTRPDYINVSILKLLKKYGVTTIELGVQSMDNDVLLASKRGHFTSDVIRASRLIRLFNINLGHQIMIGLPNSTLDKEIYTINTVLNLRVKELRIYPVYVIEDSTLYDMYKENKYRPLDFYEAVLRVVEVVKICSKTDVKIIRLGLQSTDEITSSNSKIVGPVCDNFAEYVMAIIAREQMENKINLEEDKKVVFEVKNKYTSIVVGPKKINKEYFKQKYNIEIGVKSI